MLSNIEIYWDARKEPFKSNHSQPKTAFHMFNWAQESILGKVLQVSWVAYGIYGAALENTGKRQSKKLK